MGHLTSLSLQICIAQAINGSATQNVEACAWWVVSGKGKNSTTELNLFIFRPKFFLTENKTLVAACEAVHDTISIGKENLEMSRVHLAMRYTNVSSERACDSDLNNLGEIVLSKKWKKIQEWLLEAF